MKTEITNVEILEEKEEIVILQDELIADGIQNSIAESKEDLSHALIPWAPAVVFALAKPPAFKFPQELKADFKVLQIASENCETITIQEIEQHWKSVLDATRGKLEAVASECRKWGGGFGTLVRDLQIDSQELQIKIFNARNQLKKARSLHVLGLTSEEAFNEQRINKRWKDLLDTHPDKQQQRASNPAVTFSFQEINEAKKFLLHFIKMHQTTSASSKEAFESYWQFAEKRYCAKDSEEIKNKKKKNLVHLIEKEVLNIRQLSFHTEDEEKANLPSWQNELFNIILADPCWVEFFSSRGDQKPYQHVELFPEEGFEEKEKLRFEEIKPLLEKELTQEQMSLFEGGSLVLFANLFIGSSDEPSVYLCFHDNSHEINVSKIEDGNHKGQLRLLDCTGYRTKLKQQEMLKDIAVDFNAVLPHYSHLQCVLQDFQAGSDRILQKIPQKFPLKQRFFLYALSRHFPSSLYSASGADLQLPLGFICSDMDQTLGFFPGLDALKWKHLQRLLVLLPDPSYGWKSYANRDRYWILQTLITELPYFFPDRAIQQVEAYNQALLDIAYSLYQTEFGSIKDRKEYREQIPVPKPEEIKTRAQKVACTKIAQLNAVVTKMRAEVLDTIKSRLEERCTYIVNDKARELSPKKREVTVAGSSFFDSEKKECADYAEPILKKAQDLEKRLMKESEINGSRNLIISYMLKCSGILLGTILCAAVVTAFVPFTEGYKNIFFRTKTKQKIQEASSKILQKLKR